MKPVRIQRKRTKGWRMPPSTVYVGRPTKWGNPYMVGDHEGCSLMTLEDVLRRYRHLIEAPGRCESVRRELRGKNLACWCPLDRECHADFLLQIANQ